MRRVALGGSSSLATHQMASRDRDGGRDREIERGIPSEIEAESEEERNIERGIQIEARTKR